MALKRLAGDGSGLTWTKSSYSDNEDGACVEVAATPGTIHIRDSKDTAGPQLGFTAATWTTFVSYTVTS